MTDMPPPPESTPPGSQPQQQQPQKPPQSPPQYQQPYQPQPLKDRGLVLIIEILPGLFGIYGIGWIYSGNTSTGLMFLIGGLIWDAIAVVVGILTGAIACICTLPINLVIIAVSTFMLNNYTKSHPELFGI